MCLSLKSGLGTCALIENSDRREIGRTWLWAELEKIARFKKLQSSSIVFQNDLAFLGRIGKASLSEFPEIYGLCDNWLYW